MQLKTIKRIYTTSAGVSIRMERKTNAMIANAESTWRDLEVQGLTRGRVLRPTGLVGPLDDDGSDLFLSRGDLMGEMLVESPTGLFLKLFMWPRWSQ